MRRDSESTTEADQEALGQGFEANDHNCFGCGSLNEHGLQLHLVPDPDGEGVYTHFVPQARSEGYTGMVHGGVITTVLDEVMAWSLYRHGIWAVTGQLTTRYRKPIRIGEETIARGEIDRDRGRVLVMRGEIRRASDGTLLADGTATFVRVPASQALEWRERYGPIATRDGDRGEIVE